MRYIGIPYKKGGCSLEGCDCYGLVRLYYATELGVSLPSTPDMHACADIFSRVDDIQKDDVIVFDINGEKHVGVAVSSTRFLHNISRHSSVISRIGEYLRHITGVYRCAS